MKVKTIVICFLFLMIGLSGCEELEELGKPDYITVTVYCSVMATYEKSGESKPLTGILVKVEIIKDGGERVSDIVSIDEYGLESKKVIGTFNVYNKQSIECIGNVILESTGSYPGFTFNSGYQSIPWSTIDNFADFGESTEIASNIKITGVKN